MLSPENYERMIDYFLVRYPFTYEYEYNVILRKRRKIDDDDYISLAKLFYDFGDYIIDFYTSAI